MSVSPCCPDGVLGRHQVVFRQEARRDILREGCGDRYLLHRYEMLAAQQNFPENPLVFLSFARAPTRPAQSGKRRLGSCAIPDCWSVDGQLALRCPAAHGALIAAQIG